MELPLSDLEEKFKELENNTDNKINALEGKTAEQIADAITVSEKNIDEKLKLLEDNTNQKLTDLESNTDQKITDAVAASEKNTDKKLTGLENKTAEQIADAIKESKTDVDQKLNDLESKLNKEKWIIGEYKWMPVGSKMPEGWVKVDIPEGHTLVEGHLTGVTPGNVGKHKHTFNDNFFVLTIKRNDAGNNAKLYFINERTAGAIGKKLIPFVNNINDTTVIMLTDDKGQGISKTNDNMAAGLLSELWQYKG